MIKPKAYGGTGLGGIGDFNLTMLAKWWWRYKNEPNQLWNSVVNSIHKSVLDKYMIPCKKSVPGIWKDIGVVGDELKKYDINIQDKMKVSIGDGVTIRFWGDVWLTPNPLKVSYPDLYRLAKNKNGKVKDYWSGTGTNIQWSWEWTKNPTTSNEWAQLSALMNQLQQVIIKGNKDMWVWENKDMVDFSARCLRSDLMTVNLITDDNAALVWNSWAPLKSKYLLWRALLGKVAAKKELGDRGVEIPNILCDRCGYSIEDTNHVFANCLWSRSIWWQICVWMRIPVPSNLSSLKGIVET
ncbi:putative reverse transcriptase zinc-binding domain-containing protein [Helianthus annuus]|nr:putative reverse transcriptase zinc-binding domain-containing protein [Helianthus annuus]